MDEKSLYAHILNLTAPWQVKSLSLDENAGSVTVTVRISENARLAVRPVVKSVLFTITVIVNSVILIPASSPLLLKPMCPALCAEYGCQTLPVPWAGPGSRYTLRFESFVLSWLKISTVDADRKQLKPSWNAVDGIMIRAVKRGLARIKKPLPACHMNVDEIAFKKGNRYITVISDRDGRALALTGDRGTESLASYLRTLTDGQLLANARRRDRYRRTRNFSFRDRLHEALFPLCYCPPPPDRHHCNNRGHPTDSVHS
ncbi:Transposase [Escherichia coli]